MKPLDPRKYDCKIVASDKVYYSQYPFKVRLIGNSINYADIDKSAAIVRYVHDDFHSKHMKIVDNYTRHVYFKTLDAFEEFMYIFGDAVNLIMGPISKSHCDALQKVNSTSNYALEQWEIRKNKYFGTYDTKLVWDWPQVAEVYGAANVVTQTHQSSNWYKYFEDLGDNVMSVADSKTNTRNTYLNEKDIEDVQFFMKLQKGNVIKNIIRVIIIKND